MSKIISTTAKEKDGKYVCPNCEHDGLKVVAHADGRTFYEYYYNCLNCSAVVKFRYARRPNSMFGGMR